MTEKKLWDQKFEKWEIPHTNLLETIWWIKKDEHGVFFSPNLKEINKKFNEFIGWRQCFPLPTWTTLSPSCLRTKPNGRVESRGNLDSQKTQTKESWRKFFSFSWWSLVVVPLLLPNCIKQISTEKKETNAKWSFIFEKKKFLYWVLSTTFNFLRANAK